MWYASEWDCVIIIVQYILYSIVRLFCIGFTGPIAELDMRHIFSTLQRHLVSLLSYSHQAFVSFPNPSSSFFERVTYLSTVNKMPVMFPRGHVAGGKYGSVMLQVVVVVVVMLQVVVGVVKFLKKTILLQKLIY